MRSSKQAAAALVKNPRDTSGHIHTLHRRLHQALDLGTRYYQGNQWKWKCTDIEIQRHVVRSIASFLDSISAAAATSHHPLVKESVANIVGALVWILQYKSEAVLNLAADVVGKLVVIIPNPILQPYLLELVHPLSSLLSSCNEVSISCASALNVILSNLSVLQERNAWEIMIGAKTVYNIINSILKFSNSSTSIESFHEMVSLLSAIMYRWPSSRYAVWNDAKLMDLISAMFEQPDFIAKAAILKLYAGLALCSNGAMKLLENGEKILRVMIVCMDNTHPISVRIEGYRLAQCLATSGQGCLKLLALSCEPIIDAIINGMRGWSSSSGEISNDQMTLLLEACRLALITRWAGKHHDYFWKQEIARVLLDILLQGFQDGPSQHCWSLEDQISKAEKGLRANSHLVLRPYIWNILGWLAIHCRENLNPEMQSHQLHIDMLIVCACLSFADLIRKGCQICQNELADTFRNESVLWAVLMMIYSPCKYIASRSRFVFSEILNPIGKGYLKHLLQSINFASSRENFGKSDLLQTGSHLIVLACYSSLPHYQTQIIKDGGVKALVTIIRWCLGTDICIGRLSAAPDLYNKYSQRTCCWVHKEDWEGDDIVLFYGLWGLSKLIHCESVRNKLDNFIAGVDYTEGQFINTLQDICYDASAPGLKWYAAYILSYFGIYGFPSRIGQRIGKALDETEFADIRLVFSTGYSLTVHGAVLAFRCPSLLPPEEFILIEKSVGGPSVKSTNELHRRFQKEIRLSSHVDVLSFYKLLEFVYFGYLHAGEELLKRLKILVKHCNLQVLLVMLSRRRPIWGELFPKYDLSQALDSAGHRFSDVVLEAKETWLDSWACKHCSLLQPHVHAHKIVLWSSCDYFRALFQSGMLESRSQTINIPVSWEAVIKLVNWFYTYELPNPPSGCLWDNMDTEGRLHALQPYLELCWLAKLWFLEEIYDISYGIVVSCLDSARLLSIDVIKIAAEFSLWQLAEVAAKHLAPLYRQLCDSGALETMGEEQIEMIRAASVRLSQEGC